MAVLRQVPAEHLVPLADRLVEAGIRSLEITHDYDRATDDVALLDQRYGTAASVGVGTTWSVEQAESAAAAGATFCVIPGVDAPTAGRAETREAIMPACSSRSWSKSVRRASTAVACWWFSLSFADWRAASIRAGNSSIV